MRSSTVSGVVHPWRQLRALAHFTLLWHDGGDMGVTDHVDKTISLRRGMTWAERRCTVLHEVIHAQRGPAMDTIAEREEMWVQRQTARILLPDVRALGEALAWSGGDYAEAAAELDVDEGVLRDRLRALSGPEYAYLWKRLGEADQEAAASVDQLGDDHGSILGEDLAGDNFAR